jgi:uncharacterized protein (TIRG00374 family)
MKGSGAVKWGAGFVLSALLLAWVVRGVDLSTVWGQIRQASPGWLVLSVVLGVSQNVFRVLRWGALLSPVRADLPFRPMFSAVILGYMTSWLIPGRLGELVRPALLSTRERLPLGPCLGSVLADRLLDGITVLVLFAAGLAVTPLTGEAATHADTIRTTAFVLVAVISIPLVALLVISTRRASLERWVAGKSGATAWIGGMVLSVSMGIEALRRPRLILRIWGNSLIAWLLIAGASWVGVRACGAQIPFGAMLVILPLLMLGIALPTPGGAGGYHAAMTFGLTRLFSVDQATAVGASFVVHALMVVPVVVLGAVLLVVDDIPFRDLLRVGRSARPAAGGAAEKTP